MTANFRLKIRVQDVLSPTCSDANLTLLGQELIVNKSSLDTNENRNRRCNFKIYKRFLLKNI